MTLVLMTETQWDGEWEFDWEQVKASVMYRAVVAKYAQHPALAAELGAAVRGLLDAAIAGAYIAPAAHRALRSRALAGSRAAGGRRRAPRAEVRLELGHEVFEFLNGAGRDERPLRREAEEAQGRRRPRLHG